MKCQSIERKIDNVGFDSSSNQRQESNFLIRKEKRCIIVYL